MKLSKWWFVNASWIVIFGFLVINALVRKVDEAGIPQTPKLRMVELTHVGIAFGAIFLLQLIILIFTLIKNKQKADQ